MRNKRAKSLRRRAREIATADSKYREIGGTRRWVPMCVRWWEKKFKKLT